MYKTVLLEINKKVQNYLNYFEIEDNEKKIDQDMLIETKKFAIQEINKKVNNLTNYF